MSALEELKAIVRSNTNSTHAVAEDTVRTVLSYIQTKVQAGEDVAITGFGTFSLVDRQARKGFNPKTGETLDIPAKKAVKFKASKKFL